VNLPFTLQQFFEVMQRYKLAAGATGVWLPLQPNAKARFA
jgi:hypothetical protein